jgi:hypothetical protein
LIGSKCLGANLNLLLVGSLINEGSLILYKNHIK